MSEETKFGPAMMALTAKERLFVIALVESGMNQSKAYIAAGYSASSVQVITAESSRIAHRPKVITAMREEAERRLKGGALLAAVAIMEIASDPMHKDRFKAASRLLDQNGLVVTTKHEVHVIDHRTTQQLIARATDLAGRLGMDPAKLLGTYAAAQLPAPVVVDAEYEEVGSTEGLEDLL